MATRKRKRRSPEEREKILADFDRSTLAAPQYAAKHGIAIATLDYWIRKRGGRLPPSHRPEAKKKRQKKPPNKRVFAWLPADRHQEFAKLCEERGVGHAATVFGTSIAAGYRARAWLRHRGEWPEPAPKAKGGARGGRPTKVPKERRAEFVQLCEVHGVRHAAEHFGLALKSAYGLRDRMKKRGEWNAKGEPTGNGHSSQIVVAKSSPPRSEPLQLDFSEAALEPLPEPTGEDAWQELQRLLMPLQPRDRIRVMTLVDALTS